MFTTGQKVISKVSEQGLTSGRTYTITDVRKEHAFGGSVTMYQVEDSEGNTKWVGNGHIVLAASKDGARV